MIESSFDDYLAEQMKNPKFKEEWDALEAEYAAARAEEDCAASEHREVHVTYGRMAIRPVT